MMPDADAQRWYRTLCDAERSISLFHQPWWLDAACGKDGWQVSIVVRGGLVHAAMPYVLKRRGGFTIVSQPPLTQFLGPWIRDTGAKLANDYSRQQELMGELIAGLPRYDHFHQSWSPGMTNWLPFHWKGFTQTTRYTYRLEGLNDYKSIHAGFRDNIRKEIRRAEGRAGVVVNVDDDLKDFLRLNGLAFARQGKSAPVSEAFVRALYSACSARQCRRILVARDSQGRAHAAAYLVWCNGVAYYLMGGGDPDLRTSGATSLCLAKAIEMSASVAQVFDFEGSMLEPIERFFRAFGAVQTPYFRVSRTPSRLIRAYLLTKALTGRQ